MARAVDRAPSHCIDEIYEAALDGERWSRALGALERRLKARRSRLEVLSPEGELLLRAAGPRTEGPIGPCPERPSESPRIARSRARSAIALDVDGPVARARFALAGLPAVGHLALERSRAASWPAQDRGELAMLLQHLERALRVAIRLRAGAPALAAPPSDAPVPELPPSFWQEIEAELQRGRGLTPCEARVAIRFAQGGSIPSVAHDLRVAVETIRTHLKRVYQKLGTTRQAELVHLLLTHGHVRLPVLPRQD